MFATMNFKYVPRFRLRGHVQRWSLHPDDYITMVLNDVDPSNVDASRSDLHYFKCGRMAQATLNEYEATLDNLWKAMEWAIDDKSAQFCNCFYLADSVAAYNTNQLQLPTDGLCRLRITVQGVHNDSRFGATYLPIIIMEEMIIGRPPLINVGGKRMMLPEPGDDDSDDSCHDDDDDSSEEEEEASVHPRLLTKDSVRMWQATDEAIRRRYYQCVKHVEYICPDCKVHIPNWENFSSMHYGCSCFNALTKAVICDTCLK